MALDDVTTEPKDHDSPVDAGEFLLRRILKGWYNPNKKNNPIPQRFFKPRPWKSEDKPGDFDGLSVFRECITPLEVAATRPDNNSLNDVARFPAKAAFDLGLTVEPKAPPSKSGEALIIELRSFPPDGVDNTVEIEEWAIALRSTASIVFEAP